MTLPRSQEDKTLDASDETCPHYTNTSTPWWDGSQIYGTGEEQTSKLRHQQPDGKLLMTSDKMEMFLPRDEHGLPTTGFRNNWWIGLELLHTLFALEHNAICDMLKGKNQHWNG